MGYWDYDHVTLEGALQVAPALAAFLREAGVFEDAACPGKNVPRSFRELRSAVAAAAACTKRPAYLHVPGGMWTSTSVVALVWGVSL
jgi:hypothetical protein